MAMKDLDFGFYGKGLEGYMHYKTAHDRIHGDSDSALTDTFFDADMLDDAEAEALDLMDEIDELWDAVSEAQDELGQITARAEENLFAGSDLPQSFEIPLSVTITVGDSDAANEVEKPLAPPPKILGSDYDLTPHYYNGNTGYEFEVALRRAISDYFPQYRESYGHSDKFNSDIISEIFSVDKPLALRMWKWQLEHFSTALHDPETGPTMTTMNYLDSEDIEWIFSAERESEWFWRKIFKESTVIYNMQVAFLRLALKKDEIDFFHFLMDLYAAPLVTRDVDSYSYDRLLEEVLVSC